MKFNITDQDNYFIIELDKEAYTLSTTVLGGFRKIKYIVFKRVDERFNHKTVHDYCKNIINELGLNFEKTCIFLTAVNLKENRYVKYIEDDVNILFVSTIGIKYPSCIDKVYNTQTQSTINIMVIVEANLGSNALPELFEVVTQAKTITCIDIGFNCGLSRGAGTVSDATLVGYIPSNKNIQYCRLGTKIGNLVAKLVREAILNKYRNWISLNEEFKYMTDLEIEDIVRIAVDIFRKSPVPNTNINEVRELIRNYLMKFLNDPNIWCFVYAAKELDIKGFSGTIRELSIDEYLKDSHKIIADELIGTTLAIYINGWKGLMMYYWIEKLKKSNEIPELNKLPMFIDDVISALIGGILSKIYDRYLHGI